MNYKESFLVLQWLYQNYDTGNLKGHDAKISSQNSNYGSASYQNWLGDPINSANQKLFRLLFHLVCRNPRYSTSKSTGLSSNDTEDSTGKKPHEEYHTLEEYDTIVSWF
jgi:hypothetical protein